MKQLSVALNIFLLDVRWYIWAGVVALVASVVALFELVARTHDPALVDILLASILTVTALVSSERLRPPYLLSLPISTRTLYLTALASAVLAIWLPAAAAIAIVAQLKPGQDAYAVPLACGALWTATYCARWLLKAESPALSSLALLALAVHFPLLSWWLSNTPSLFTATALLSFSVAASVIAWLRLPPVFESAEGTPPARIRWPLTSNSGSGLLARIWLPRVSQILLLPLMVNANWTMGWIWILLTYPQVNQEDALVLTLPISQVQLLYVRLTISVALVAVMSLLDPLGRLLHLHHSLQPVSAILGLALALLTLVTVKLLRWHRMRQFRRLPVIAIGVLFLSYVIALIMWIVPNPIASTIGQWPAHLVVPSLGIAIVLLLWLIGIQTRESDHYPSPQATLTTA